MINEGKLVENAKIVLLGGPVLLNTAGMTGDYVSFKNYRKWLLIFALAPASGTDVAAVTLKQAKTVDNSPVTEKALSFMRMFKNGAPGTSDALVDTAVAGDTFSTSAVAALEMYCIEVDETDLDISNGFDCFRLAVSDPGSVSTPAVAIGIGYGAKFKGPVDIMPSAILD